MLAQVVWSAVSTTDQSWELCRKWAQHPSQHRYVTYRQYLEDQYLHMESISIDCLTNLLDCACP